MRRQIVSATLLLVIGACAGALAVTASPPKTSLGTTQPILFHKPPIADIHIQPETLQERSLVKLVTAIEPDAPPTIEIAWDGSRPTDFEKLASQIVAMFAPNSGTYRVSFVDCGDRNEYDVVFDAHRGIAAAKFFAFHESYKCCPSTGADE